MKTQSFSDMTYDTMHSGGMTCCEAVEIKPMDVLCGRGKNSFNHSGNRQFREIVATAIPAYVSAESRSTKSEIVTDIVRQIRENGGRFLKRDGKKGSWYVLNYTQSKEKAGHAIRDATITEDSKRERAQKRKKLRAAVVTTEKPQRRSSSMSQETATTEGESVSSSCADSVASGYDCEPSSPPNDLNFLHKDFDCEPIKSYDEPSAVSSLSSILMSHFPSMLLPDELQEAPPNTPSSFEPLPMDDPFNSYIDQLLGPMTDF